MCLLSVSRYNLPHQASYWGRIPEFSYDQMKKRYRVVLFYLLFCAACFFIQHRIVQQIIDGKAETKVEVNIMEAILETAFVAIISLFIYSVTMTLVAIAGFLIASRRKNIELKAGLRICSIIAFTGTALLALDLFVLHW